MKRDETEKPAPENPLSGAGRDPFRYIPGSTDPGSRRVSVHPEVGEVLEHHLDGDGGDAVHPRLMGDDGLVVVEEPEGGIFREDAVGLFDERELGFLPPFPCRPIEQGVILGIGVHDVVARRSGGLRVEASQGLERVGAGLDGPDEGLVVALSHALGHGRPFELLGLEGDVDFFQEGDEGLENGRAPGGVAGAKGREFETVLVAGRLHELAGLFEVVRVAGTVRLISRTARREESFGREGLPLEELFHDEGAVDGVVHGLTDPFVGKRLEVGIHAHDAGVHLGHLDEVLFEYRMVPVGRILGGADDVGVHLPGTKGDVPGRAFGRDLVDDAIEVRFSCFEVAVEFLEDDLGAAGPADEPEGAAPHGVGGKRIASGLDLFFRQDGRLDLAEGVAKIYGVLEGDLEPEVVKLPEAGDAVGLSVQNLLGTLDVSR